MFATLSIIALLATSALATPALYARQPSGGCLGTNAIVDGGPYNIVAVNKSEPLSVGLNLTTSPAIVDPIDYNRRSLATFQSYDFQEFAGYGLKFGSITALDSSGDIQAVSVSNDVGGPLDLEVGSHFPAYDFCGIVGTSPNGGNPPHPVLTYKGDGDHFSLCTGRSVYYDFDITVLIYKPNNSTSDTHGDYTLSTCYPVTVYLIEQ